MKKFLVGTGILVGIYLLVANATGTGTLVQAGSNAYNSGVKVLQGRA